MSFKFLEFCLNSYVSNEVYGYDNPFVSPILVNEEVLTKYPPTQIYCGENDPLYDHSLYLAHNLNKVGVCLKG